MRFNILDFLKKLQIETNARSWIEAICPICGERNFKINKKTGAYKCFKNNCSPSSIREFLQPFSPYIVSDPYRLSDPYSVSFTKPFEVLSPDFFSEEDFIERSSSKSLLGLEGNYRTFIYDDNRRTIRFIGAENKKVVVPQHLKNGVWTNGKGDLDWSSFYGSFYLKNTSLTDRVLFAAEGEKCAATIREETDFECISPPSFGWNEMWLKSALESLLVQINIQGIVYFRDNDSTGKLKATLFQEACWREGLFCKVINPYTIFSSTEFWVPNEDSFDIADALLINPNLLDFVL